MLAPQKPPHLESCSFYSQDKVEFEESEEFFDVGHSQLAYNP